MSKGTARLENWCTLQLWDQLRYCGTVTGHSKLPDGELIITSKVENVSEDEKTIETRNTIYTLGKFDKERAAQLEGFGDSTNSPAEAN